MQLPDGELNIITIDRVVERVCQSCDGDCREPNSPICDEEWEPLVCNTCHGTGKRKVRLRGFVLPLIRARDLIVGARLMLDGISYCSVEVEVKPHMSDPMQCVDSFAVQGPLINAVVAAYLKGELPDEIAKNIEEVIV